MTVLKKYLQIKGIDHIGKGLIARKMAEEMLPKIW